MVKLRERGTSDKTNKSRQEETRHGGRKEDIEGEKKTRQDIEGEKKTVMKTRQEEIRRHDKTLKEKRRQ